MKRDLELVRKLLVHYDDKEDTAHEENPSISGYDEECIKYHLVLLYQAGFISCEPVLSSTSDRVIYVLPFELTWDGHEFLDTIRNDYIWGSVMETIKEKGYASASIDMLKKIADNAIRKHLGDIA